MRTTSALVLDGRMGRSPSMRMCIGGLVETAHAVNHHTAFAHSHHDRASGTRMHASHAPLSSVSILSPSSSFKLALTSFPLSMDSPKAVVDLDIFETWRLWHGFQSYNHIEDIFVYSPELNRSRNTRHDPMDGSKYSEEHAFPLLKPSIDVFGIPCRSRKQRGWYHIRSPPQTSSRLLPEAALQPMRTAVDLPPELVAKITAAMSRKVSGRDLALCASVCRYWAEVLQRRLFTELSIESRTDMFGLLNLHRSSLCHIAQYKTNFNFRQNLDSTPFTHLVHRVHRTISPTSSLVVSGPLPTKQGKSLRSIHGCIPRSLPPSCNDHFHNLELQDVQFCSSADFVRLISELHNLQLMKGVRLSWSSSHEEALTTPAQWRVSRARLQMARLIDCAPHHRSSALLLIGAPDIYSVVGELARLVDDQWSQASTLAMNSSHASRLSLGE